MKDITYKIDATSVSESRADVTIRDFTVIIDEPEKLGGTNAGPNPIELELASLAGCINVTGHFVAKEMGISLKKLEIGISGTLNPAKFMGKGGDERAGYKSISASLDVESDASAEDLERWRSQIEERCPVSDNLSAGTSVEVQIAD
ncbi:MAG: OsmC family peroxiredoxin [Spirochaetaceae bacterium]|nr:MAG: OsmC family peroxiredoxin [Spirochaetaceae bacterium]